jgi:crotonobetainyl-CoA:carnitine CoA-transferase CaiB-like acyl-CoA transferase
MGNKRALSFDRRPYPTKDGVICVLPYVDKHWQSLFEVAGLNAKYGNDPRFATPTARAQHIDEIFAVLAEVLETRTTAEWLELLTKADIPCGPVQTLEGLFDDPHLKDVDFFGHYEHPSEGRMTIPKPAVWMSETSPAIETLAPKLGADTRAVLTECGYGDKEIEALLKSGVATQAES